MSELFQQYYPAILVALLIGLIIGFLIFRPRQRVRLSDDTPLRPHMTSMHDSSRESNDIAAEAAAAASDVTGEILRAPVHQHLSNDSAGADELQRIKGIGPKLADMLIAKGFTRFDQLARLSSDEIEMLDAELGPFRGRIQRDRISEQAHYLARGDIDGFEQQFGKL